MICKVCNQDKGDDFRKNRVSAKVCRECDNAAQRERTKKLKERKKPDFIVCKRCDKKTSDFVVNNRVCNDCKRAYGRNYRRTTTKAKEWAENNKERMSELRHNWYKKNLKKIREERKRRTKEDPDFKQAMYHRIASARLYKNYDTKKSVHLNCSGDLFREWIDFQQSGDMCYNNYGKVWTLDHVIPVYSFLKHEYPAEVVLNWENTRPVLKQHNLVKNKYINKEEVVAHYQKLKKFLALNDMECSEEYKKVMRKIRKEYKEQLCNQESEDEDEKEVQNDEQDLDLDEYFEQLDLSDHEIEEEEEDLTVESTPSDQSDEDVPYD